MVKLVLNGREIEAPKGATILETARENGVDIPTLCYHEALGVYGVCRLCIVEVSGSLPRSIRISCAQEVVEGLVVDTESVRVRKNRQYLFELLLARSPNSRELEALATKYGVTASRFYIGDTDDPCVRCGRCVRVCRDKIGAYALCFAHRGFDRTVTTDFERLSQTCIGCGSCTQICPTGAIRMKDEGDERTISTKGVTVAKFRLEKCHGCGKPYASGKYLDFVLGRSDRVMGVDVLRGFCPHCARAKNAVRIVGSPFSGAG